MQTLKTFKLLLIKLTFFGLALQGCGGANKNKKSQPTAVGTALSITAEEAKSEILNKEFKKLLNTHITEFNQQEAIYFSKSINYCDVSGLKNLENSEELNLITSTTNYHSCKSDNSTQNGMTTMTYTQTDEDGKFPKHLTLTANDDYNFNHLMLKKDASVKCKISYNQDNSLEQIVILINGQVEYNSKTYTLENHQEIITF